MRYGGNGTGADAGTISRRMRVEWRLAEE